VKYSDVCPKNLDKGIDMSKSETWNQVWARVNSKNLFYVESLNIEFLVRNCIRLNKGISCLEAGCGTAILSLIFASSGGYVIGLDVSKNALRIAKKIYAEKGYSSSIHTVLGDIRRMPFRSNFFDVVWNQGVVEHFKGKDRQHVIDEMARVAIRGGIIAIGVPCLLNFWHALWRLFRRQNLGLEIPYTPFELDERLRNAGLLIKCRAGTQPFFPFDIFRNKFNADRSSISKFLAALFMCGCHSLNAFFGYQLFRIAEKT